MDNPIDFVGNDKNDKDKMSKQECQQAIEEYFAEYGQDAPYVDYRENKVFARDAGENFFVIRKINGRAVAPTQNVALGSMSDDGRVMTINFYNADENMGDNAEKFQKNLDKMESRNERKNTVWHEGRHKIDTDRAGDKMYHTSAEEYLELCHDQEKSAYRESGFRELLEYKKTRNPDCITQDYKFLLKADNIDFGSDKLSEEEIKLVVNGVDEMYAKQKQGVYEKNYLQSMRYDWQIRKGDYDPSAYAELKEIYNSYSIHGQKIDVSQYTKATSVDDMMRFAINRYENMPFTEQEREKFGKFPAVVVSDDDVSRETQSVLHSKNMNWAKFAESDHNYKEFTDNGDWMAYVSANMGGEVPFSFEHINNAYLDNQKHVKVHNEAVKRRKSDLKGFIANSRGYQVEYDRLPAEKKSGTKSENIQLMRTMATKGITSEFVCAYLNGNTEQLAKIDLELPKRIEQQCKSLDCKTKSMSYDDYEALRQYVDGNLDKYMPDFEREAEIYYEQKSQSSSETSYSNEASNSLKDGHSRIVEMRAKIAAGHGNAFNKELSDSRVDYLKQLRFERARPLTYNHKQPLTAETLRKQMENAKVYG